MWSGLRTGRVVTNWLLFKFGSETGGRGKGRRVSSRFFRLGGGVGGRKRRDCEGETLLGRKVTWKDESEDEYCPAVNIFNPTCPWVLSEPLTDDPKEKIGRRFETAVGCGKGLALLVSNFGDRTVLRSESGFLFTALWRRKNRDREGCWVSAGCRSSWPVPGGGRVGALLGWGTWPCWLALGQGSSGCFAFWGSDDALDLSVVRQTLCNPALRIDAEVDARFKSGLPKVVSRRGFLLK